MCSNYDRERLTLLHTKKGTSHKFRFFFVFLTKDEVITLQAFVWLSLFQHAGVSLTGKHSPNSLCFVIPGDGKIMLTLFFYSYVNIFWVLWYCVWKHHSLLPILSASPHRVPMYWQTKPSNVCCVLGAKLISDVDGVHSGIMSWLTKTIKPRPWDYRVKWCCTEHHNHHNLERPSLAERRESREPLRQSCADRAPCWSFWEKQGAKANRVCCAHYCLKLIITLYCRSSHW